MPHSPQHAEPGADISTLIRNAQLFGHAGLADIAIEAGQISAIGSHLAPAKVDYIIDAGGGALLPGLHDHHIHLVALAAALNSLRCGPPDIQSPDELIAALRNENAAGGVEWVRGIGYHPCIAGDIDRDWLDRYIPDRPVRIQHRGGRLWILNSLALKMLGLPAGDDPPGLEQLEGRATGRLFEADQWLRTRMQARLPDLATASTVLASYGITGLTDTTPTNGIAEWAHFEQSLASGRLRQRVRMMGSREIQDCTETGFLTRGEFKIHLLESALPDLDALGKNIRLAHSNERAVAIHCVTLTELVFALSALQAAGVRSGDRIEHAAVTPPQMLVTIRDLGLRVVTQPHFIAERGDQYYADVDPEELPWLYGGAKFINSGIALAAGSDAPFGDPDPWRAMRAAVERKTRSGRILAAREKLTPEQALLLFLSRPETPGIHETRLFAGAPADLCLLASSWEQVRDDLSSRHVRLTWRAGELIFGTR